jgi:hypothetical protein
LKVARSSSCSNACSNGGHCMPPSRRSTSSMRSAVPVFTESKTAV